MSTEYSDITRGKEKFTELIELVKEAVISTGIVRRLSDLLEIIHDSVGQRIV